MADRCKEGDVAIIVQDFVGCEANLGRVVHVCGPRKVRPGRGTVWRIKPVNGNRITFLDMASNKIKRGKAYGIEHDDRWLMPIRPDADDGETDVCRSAPTPRELEVV